MKKILCRMLMLVLVMALTLSITSCKGPQYDSIEDFLAGEEMQSSIKADQSALEDSGLSLEVTSQGNQLIYSYTYAQPLEIETSKEILKEGLEAEKESFQRIAEDVRNSVKIENPVVVVRYLNPDGTEIYSQEFTAQ